MKEAICFRRAARRIHQSIDDGINEAIKTRNKAYGTDNADLRFEYHQRFVVIEHLFVSFDGDMTKVRWGLLELIGAGSNTIASLMVHALYHLSRKPQLEQQLRDEIKKSMPRVWDGAWTVWPLFPHVSCGMRFLDAFIRESMFLTPTSSLISQLENNKSY